MMIIYLKQIEEEKNYKIEFERMNRSSATVLCANLYIYFQL